MSSSFDKISINDIVPSSYNPRKISNTEYNKLSRSISEFGVISPIIINLRNNHIIGGHQRFDVLYDEYISSGEYEELNLIKVGDIGWAFPSDELTVENLSQEKAMNLALNKISGEWNIPQLQNLLIDLEVDDFDLDLTGFDNMDLEEFNIDLKTNITLPNPQEELRKTIEKEKKSRVTETIITETETVKDSNNGTEDLNYFKNKNNDEELESDENVTIYGEDTLNHPFETEEVIETEDAIIVTVAYGDLYRLGNHYLLCGDSSNKEDMSKLMNGNIVDTVFTDPPYDMKTYEYSEGINEYTEDANIFIMNNDVHILEYLKQSDLEFIEFIVANIMFCIPRNNRPYLQHILVSHEIKGDALHCRNIGKGIRSLINMKYRGFIKDDVRVHKHQKSVDFVKTILEHYAVSKVLDCFGGSGTTLIACEELGLQCFMMEIEPKFVQIIINRWENLTGEKAIKI